MGKRELVALHGVSSWCIVVVGWLFLEVQWGCLRFIIVVFPEHNHLLFLTFYKKQQVVFPSFKEFIKDERV